jgi:hypothetical protein
MAGSSRAIRETTRIRSCSTHRAFWEASPSLIPTNMSLALEDGSVLVRLCVPVQVSGNMVTKTVCLGRLFADNNLFLAIAGVLATLNVHKAIGKDDKEIDATLEYDGTSIL